ncbi:proline-rich extensin-like protein EPR1 [Echeneis naucrates]|uniref:proline-rich extensin-like protein EPR1 n=1 Tax=Echeneis naucrates TaxID=173247 RepID=UPI0011136D8A|nr:proline-rich extensin-like protein EPR1 [Echeneis naucrates]
MKKGRHFLGRKNQSLFDTNIKIRDLDNVELVLDSPAIPESGTASVRARPTVKHHASSDSFQGFAVPTPKVPLLPLANGPKVNGSVGEEKLWNGSLISGLDQEEEIFVPPPPSMAPPPPPGTFVPPPPDFSVDLNSPELAMLQSPSMPAPKPPRQALSMEKDLGCLKPPPMAPPQPPSSGSVSSTPIFSPPIYNVPEHPKFAPPPPPTEKKHKTPPPKPIRLSSMSNIDSPPATPAPPPPRQTPTPSSFNPQNTAKLYNVPKTSPLRDYQNQDTRPKQMLLLEDSKSVNSSPVLVHVEGKVPQVAPPSTPVSKAQELKEDFQIRQPSQEPLSKPIKEAKTATISAQPEISEVPFTPPQKPPQVPISSPVTSESSKGKLEPSPSDRPKFSPLLDRKLRKMKASEASGSREGHAASPFALLMAAKEREKQRSTHSLSRENSTKKDEQPKASIHASDSSSNSFVVIPRPNASQERIVESSNSDSHVKHMQTIQTSEEPSSPALVPTPNFNIIKAATSPSATNLVQQKYNSEQSPPKTQTSQEDISMPLLPPPPEFDDLEEVVESPPSICPPDPPVKKTPTPSVILPPPVKSPPLKAPAAPPPVKSPPLKAPAAPPPVKSPPQKAPPAPPLVKSPPQKAPPAPPPVKSPPPKLPTPHISVKPKPQVQAKTKTAPTQLSSNLSPSQATLLSILQKKMLEMDQKMAPVKEAESSNDDWEVPLPTENNNIPVVSSTTPQSKKSPTVNKLATLNMQELEGKVAKRYQETPPPPSNGPSKHQYGMTFTVRPGTKQPITPVTRSES